MGYRHTQHAPLHLLLWFLIAGMVASAVIVRHTPVVAITFVAMAGVLGVLALCFRTLTVSDEDDALHLRIGTNDQEGLMALLNERIERSAA